MPKSKLHVITNEGIHYLNAHLKKKTEQKIPFREQAGIN